MRRSIDALLESHAMRDLGTTTISLHIGVLMAVMTGRFEHAAEMIGAFEASCERYGVRPPAALSTFIEVTDPFGATREALSADVYAAAYERGSRMTLDEAVARVAEVGEAAAVAVPGAGATTVDDNHAVGGSAADAS
jgi:hypothetical protein